MVPSPLAMRSETVWRFPSTAVSFGLLTSLKSLKKEVTGPSTFWMLSPLKLLVRFSIPTAALSSFCIIAEKSGCSAVRMTLSGVRFGTVAVPRLMETKFCPMRPANLMVALASVFTSASGSNFIVTFTRPCSKLIFSTLPMGTPAILTASPTLSSCAVLNRPWSR